MVYNALMSGLTKRKKTAVKKSKRQSWLARHTKLMRFMVAAIVVSTVAFAGSYIVLRSNAQVDSAPDNAITISSGGSRGLIDFKKGSVPLYVYLPPAVYTTPEDHYTRNNPQQIPTWHLSLRIGMNVKVTNIVCATGYTCQVDSSSYSGPSSQSAINNGQMQSLYLCVNLTKPDYGKNLTIMTFIVDASTAVTNTANGRDWIIIPSAEQGACLTPAQLSSNPAETGWSNQTHDHRTYGYQDAQGAGGYYSLFGWSMGAWGVSPSTAPGGAPGGAGNGEGTGDGSGGTGTGSDGTGNGDGGGGGSSATQQSNESTAIPESTSQGSQNEQNVIDPSPFYDGKLFVPGSDESWVSTEKLASGTKKVITAWPLSVSLVIILACGAMVLRLWHKRRGVEIGKAKHRSSTARS